MEKITLKGIEIRDISNPKRKEIQRLANSIAKRNGFGRATKIVLDPDCETDGEVIYWVDYGYRKCTTDEYVPNAYRYNFGWKNTYYQPAECVVALPAYNDLPTTLM